ncbi:MAG: hypothetical protein EKK63_12700 [Acinetobacter sp.]|uniref:hypothetical protein n=1 Tax=Acinetobacter sp. TaxID=472 RepID=UPI000FAD51D3|nr:hypothetical protein [Acinetobacter sp.]RUP38233.1 MAG: hypothetical protein EKK63_12700 [Acinetobacter sp.]
MSKIKNIAKLIETAVHSLAEIKEKELLKPETIDRVDDFINKVLDKLDKLEVCLEKANFCEDEKPTDDGGGQQEPAPKRTYIGFSLNLYTVVAGVTRFAVEVDGVVYAVTAEEGEDGIALHNRMKNLLAAVTEPFKLQEFRENGSATNYGYTLQSEEAFLGKKVTVSVEGGGTSYGNITIQRAMSPALPDDPMNEQGKAPGVGYFEFPL